MENIRKIIIGGLSVIGTISAVYAVKVLCHGIKILADSEWEGAPWQKKSTDEWSDEDVIEIKEE